MSDKFEIENRFITVTVTPPPAKFELFFDQMVATEELGRPFLYELLLVSATQKLDLTSILGTIDDGPAIQLEAEGQLPLFQRHRHPHELCRAGRGVPSATASSCGPGSGCCRASRIAGFSRTRRSPTIIKQRDIQRRRLQQRRVSDKTAEFQANYFSMEFCVQYRESSFDFVTRLMEEAGIYYYFTHEEGKHTFWCWRTIPNSHSAPPGPHQGRVLRSRRRSTGARTTMSGTGRRI